MGMTEFWASGRQSQCHIFEWEKTHFGNAQIPAVATAILRDGRAYARVAVDVTTARKAD